MTNSQRRARDETNDATTSRVVRPRHSILSDDPYRTERTDSNEEPMENESDYLPTHLRTPSPLPTTVPSAPAIPPPPVYPPFRFVTREEEGTLRWDWMPHILDWWRRAENIPIVPDVPGTIPMSSLIQEPAHRTIPVLVTRLLTHDYQLDQLDRALHEPPPEVEHLQHQVSGVENELAELRDNVVTTYTRGIDTQLEIAALRQQVTALQQEVATMRAEREQADTASSARSVNN